MRNAGLDYTAYQSTIREPSWVSRLDVRYAIQHLRVLCEDLLMRALVFELAHLDSQGELILLRRQRAGREVRECARRIEGFVEVDLDAIRIG